jgi:hypothetical protein
MKTNTNPTYGDLYAYLEGKLDCTGPSYAICRGVCSHKWSERFARKHNLDWDYLRRMLEMEVGYCDCEVLMNVADPECLMWNGKTLEETKIGEEPW